MKDFQNPFALVRASDFSDTQINALWVELGPAFISALIEPRSRQSKYILGGKGTGKTHLLRYHSYSAARLRFKNEEGVKTVARLRFLGVFVRATNIDAGRFEFDSEQRAKWQRLFGVYLELRLAEGLLDALAEIKRSSTNSLFDDAALVAEVLRGIHDPEASRLETLEALAGWVEAQRRTIDVAVDNAAFTGQLNIQAPFSIGGLCIPLTRTLPRWNAIFDDAPVIFLLDEIENFSESQQQVVNSLIRYGEGVLTFRITGRLYSRRTLSTIANGEENREGSEFTTIELDNILRAYGQYPAFAQKFVARRLLAGGAGEFSSGLGAFDPTRSFESIDTSNFYEDQLRSLGLVSDPSAFFRPFRDAVQVADGTFRELPEHLEEIQQQLSFGFPLLIARLNILIFCKKLRRGADATQVARDISQNAKNFIQSPNSTRRSAYATAYQHYSSDLFAQICRESRKLSAPIYAGFETFVKMSSGNPRNLLICLGRLYEIASFRELDLSNMSTRLPIEMQSQAAAEAARFMYERDTNYGADAEGARSAVNRLGTILRTARYALNIPEVSPLTISFASDCLSGAARNVLRSALKYSFLYEINEGRPDRNSEGLLRKVQLNPLLAPKWGLPTARRGDLTLNREAANAIFDPALQIDFDVIAKNMNLKWNRPFSSRASLDASQPTLF